MRDSEALVSLVPGAQWSLDGDSIIWKPVLDENKQDTGQVYASNLQWYSEDFQKPSREEIEAEVIRLQAEYEATEYQRLRQPEYPPLADLADALYWQAQGDDSKMTAYLAAVEAVKQKYPKGV